DLGRALGGDMPHQRADLDLAACDSDPVEAADAVDVDEQRRAGEPHVEGGNQALAAGEQLGVAVVALEQLDRMRDRAGPGISEWCRLQRASPLVGLYCRCRERRVNAARPPESRAAHATARSEDAIRAADQTRGFRWQDSSRTRSWWSAARAAASARRSRRASRKRARRPCWPRPTPRRSPKPPRRSPVRERRSR